MVGQKRKTTFNMNIFKVTSGHLLYNQNLEGKHPENWAVYKFLLESQKVKIVTGATPVVKLLRAHFVGTRDKVFLDIDVPILDNLILKFLCDPGS